eukprot:912658-Prymnesium_polylepis.1
MATLPPSPRLARPASLLPRPGPTDSRPSSPAQPDRTRYVGSGPRIPGPQDERACLALVT